MSRPVVIAIMVVLACVVASVIAFGGLVWSRTVVEVPVYEYRNGTCVRGTPGIGVVYALRTSDQFVMLVSRAISDDGVAPQAQMRLMVRRALSVAGYESPHVVLYADLTVEEHDWIRAHGIPDAVERKFLDYAGAFVLQPVDRGAMLGPGVPVPIDGLIGQGK